MLADGLILAGGRNSRMQGRYKGDLELGGASFSDHLAEVFRKICGRVYLSYGETSHGEKAGCIVIRDIHPGIGPLAGLESGLTHCSADCLFVGACDMPYLSEAYYRYLAQEAEAYREKTGHLPDCVIPQTNGRPDMLAGMYRKSLLPAIHAQIERGEYKPRLLLDEAEVLFVQPDAAQGFGSVLDNINTPEEYEALRKKRDTQ